MKILPAITTVATLLHLLAAPAIHADDDWIDGEFKVAGGGMLRMSYPEYWGKKPERNANETITDLKFGPYGPRSKPVFMVRVTTIQTGNPTEDPDILAIIKEDVNQLQGTAAETKIEIHGFEGPAMKGTYFSITDRESKYGEFDYLTMAVISSNRLLIKCYFLSSDGAPDYGADAMDMMRNLKYIPPPPEEEKKKKKKRRG